MTGQIPRTGDRIGVAPNADAAGTSARAVGVDSASLVARDCVGVLRLAPSAMVERSTAAHSIHVDSPLCVT